jgi:hypothetical protein
MRRRALLALIVPALAASCAAHRETPTSGTLAELRSVRPDLQEATIEQGLDQAMQGYRRFLEETPETAMTPEAMRRLADLKLEKQFGIRTGDAKPREMAAPATASAPRQPGADASRPGTAAGSQESEEDFEQRTTAASGLTWAGDDGAAGAARAAADPTSANEAIALYDKAGRVPELQG